MNDNGYVYVLMNPSMKGLVKIGKSARNSQERANELSSTTGVPTPFVVVYDYYFESCTKAEQYVHTYLEGKGFRVSQNREFFEIPVKDAVDALMTARNHFGEFIPQEINNFDEEGIFSEESEDDIKEKLHLLYTQKYKEPWEEMFETAKMHYYGDDDEIVDYAEAMHFFLQAIKLGSIDSYFMIGKMYIYGEGVREDKNKAFKYFKEGAKKGDTDCFAEMAKLFTDQENIESALKCWKKYFEQTSTADVSYLYGQSYIQLIDFNNLELEYIDKLLVVKDEIIKWYRDGIESLYETGGEDIIPNFEQYIEFVECNVVAIPNKLEEEITNSNISFISENNEVNKPKSLWKRLFS